MYFDLPQCNYNGIFHEILLNHGILTIIHIRHTLNQGVPLICLPNKYELGWLHKSHLIYYIV